MAFWKRATNSFSALAYRFIYPNKFNDPVLRHDVEEQTSRFLSQADEASAEIDKLNSIIKRSKQLVMRAQKELQTSSYDRAVFQKYQQFFKSSDAEFSTQRKKVIALLKKLDE